MDVETLSDAEVWAKGLTYNNDYKYTVPWELYATSPDSALSGLRQWQEQDSSLSARIDLDLGCFYVELYSHSDIFCSGIQNSIQQAATSAMRQYVESL